jgi:hypothetical protein
MCQSLSIQSIVFLRGWDASCCVIIIGKEVKPSIATVAIDGFTSLPTVYSGQSVFTYIIYILCETHFTITIFTLKYLHC